MGYVWKDGIWLHAETGKPYSVARQHFKHLEKRRIYEQRRYWNPNTGVRVRRLERSARAGGKPFKIKPLQLKLRDLASVCVQTAAVTIARDVNLSSD